MKTGQEMEWHDVGDFTSPADWLPYVRLGKLWGKKARERGIIISQHA
jgi:hypothetical protein